MFNLCLLYAIAFVVLGLMVSFAKAWVGYAARFWRWNHGARFVVDTGMGETLILLTLGLVWRPLQVEFFALAGTNLVVALLAHVALWASWRLHHGKTPLAPS